MRYTCGVVQVVGPLYAEVLVEAAAILGASQQLRALWPASEVRTPWSAALEGFYTAAIDLAVVPVAAAWDGPAAFLTPREVVFPDAMASR